MEGFHHKDRFKPNAMNDEDADNPPPAIILEEGVFNNEEANNQQTEGLLEEGRVGIGDNEEHPISSTEHLDQTNQSRSKGANSADLSPEPQLLVGGRTNLLGRRSSWQTLESSREQQRLANLAIDTATRTSLKTEFLKAARI